MRFAAIALLIAIQLYVFLEVINVKNPRYLPKVAWLLIAGLLPVIGPALWFAGGRPRPNRIPPPPDDDQGFLDSLR